MANICYFINKATEIIRNTPCIIITLISDIVSSSSQAYGPASSFAAAISHGCPVRDLETQQNLQ